MKVSGDTVGQLITILMAAKMRGWLDLHGIEPLLQIVVESGNADNMRGVLTEVIELLDRIEKDMAKRRGG